MIDHECNRAVQYVTSRTSYSHETVAEILKTGFYELSSLATQTTCQFDRETVLEYVLQWTIKRTGKRTGRLEPLVREVLGCAG
ncbi:MAG: hypothetical protein NNA20_09705 [Nitrospira sp.]|nr:hypothetical protein [Nitrospira sp.]MCP9442858.1 hypothetical protein [Nitrospira sp.]